MEALPPEEKKYIEVVNGKIYVIKAPERYVNHSCNPNTHPGEACDIAIRNIDIGEEITSDYRLSNSKQSFICWCGALNCQGKIVTTDDL